MAATFTSDWFSAGSRAWLAHVSPRVGRAPVRWLEVGSYEGRSALWVLDNVLPSGSTVTCVDHFDRDYEARFDANVAGNTGILKIKGKSRDVLPGLAPGFVGAYVDGSHEEEDVLVDARLSWRLLVPGAVLVFDDYGMAGPRVAIDAFLAETGDQARVLFFGYQLFVAKV